MVHRVSLVGQGNGTSAPPPAVVWILFFSRRSLSMLQLFSIQINKDSPLQIKFGFGSLGGGSIGQHPVWQMCVVGTIQSGIGVVVVFVWV